VDLQDAKKISLTMSTSRVVTALEKPLAKINRTYNCRKMWLTMMTISQIKRVDVYGIAGML
jgi:hypothetical protein